MTPQEIAETLAFVKTIIADEGRLITLVKFSTTPPDPSKPHKLAADPWGAPIATQDVHAVFVPLSSLQQLGMITADKSKLYGKCSAVAMLEPIDEIDFGSFTGFLDGTDRYILSVVDKLKPGPATLLWAIGGDLK